MAADLTQPFKESCCDGGACNLDDGSTQYCGCDKGAGWTCERHLALGKLAISRASGSPYYIGEAHTLPSMQDMEDIMRDTVPAFDVETVERVVVIKDVMPKTTVAEVKDFRRALYDKSMAMIDRKGADYNRDQQIAGDTLFNLRVCELLGVVPSAEEGILVRLSDKMMRLISLTKPGRDAAVKDESVLDTIADIHNYVDYLGLIWQQRRANK